MFERDVARRFRELTGDDQVRRGRQDGKDRFTGNNHEGDVVGVPGLWVECKWVQVGKVSLGAWWAQARADAEGTGLEPVVVFRWDGGKPIVAVAQATLKKWGIVFSLTTPLPRRVSWTSVDFESAAELHPTDVAGEAIVLGCWRAFEELWRSRDS